jgi:hypothetical protein
MTEFEHQDGIHEASQELEKSVSNDINHVGSSKTGGPPSLTDEKQPAIECRFRKTVNDKACKCRWKQS